MRELRLAAGLRQDDLAERCGMFRTYVSRIENGTANPTIVMADALAASLGVPLVALFVEEAEVQRWMPTQGAAEPSSPVTSGAVGKVHVAPEKRGSRGRVR